MTEADSTDYVNLRCEVRGCKNNSTGLLIYEVGKEGRPWYRRFDHPLCERHSDPKFHLRPLTRLLKPTNWRWEPVDA